MQQNNYQSFGGSKSYWNTARLQTPILYICSLAIAILTRHGSVRIGQTFNSCIEKGYSSASTQINVGGRCKIQNIHCVDKVEKNCPAFQSVLFL